MVQQKLLLVKAIALSRAHRTCISITGKKRQIARNLKIKNYP